MQIQSCSAPSLIGGEMIRTHWLGRKGNSRQFASTNEEARLRGRRRSSEAGYDVHPNSRTRGGSTEHECPREFHGFKETSRRYCLFLA
ncbi:hypothetical protein PNOK_0603700 [Pyrrhoderma noxium]|uniref:Uncharacterized protein n=1 Tax=Pyrrhoderma noxium TaxID=2282107 RepID=A0A286UHV5_9AGAM|nr:hypothetical protein PNOK_0603700 [Pyrrhoderma noxium]